MEKDNRIEDYKIREYVYGGEEKKYGRNDNISVMGEEDIYCG